MTHSFTSFVSHFAPSKYCAGVVAATAVFGALTAANVSAAVSVNFIEPDKFLDIPFAVSERDDTLKKLREHFEKRGAALPTGTDLKVEVLDVDLAGRREPLQLSASTEMRILRGGADWPMMRFRYVVEANGKVMKSGEVKLAELNYLQRYNRYPTSEPLRYEKQMIDEWFYKEIQARQ
jgi:hypothetical protein